MTLAKVKESEGTKTYSFVNGSYTITVKLTKVNESVGIAQVVVPSVNSPQQAFTCSESVTGRFGLCIMSTSPLGALMTMNNNTITISSSSSNYTVTNATYTVPVVFY